MGKLERISVFIFFVCSFAGFHSTCAISIRELRQSTEMPTTDMETMLLDLEAIKDECNKSFKIDISYINSLNESGSFIDETEKTPKCFIRCFLQKSDVMNDNGEFNLNLAADLLYGIRNGQVVKEISDILAKCSEERYETCMCEKAYSFAKCVMEMEIEIYDN